MVGDSGLRLRLRVPVDWGFMAGAAGLPRDPVALLKSAQSVPEGFLCLLPFSRKR